MIAGLVLFAALVCLTFISDRHVNNQPAEKFEHVRSDIRERVDAKVDQPPELVRAAASGMRS